jgi:hypothetical protein
MAESAALPVDEVFPEHPVRQWELSVPYPLRYLFASCPEIMGRVLSSFRQVDDRYQHDAAVQRGRVGRPEMAGSTH